MQLLPTISFQGDCEAAFHFYGRVLGAKIERLIPFAGTPAAAQMPGAENKILHGRLKLGEGTLLAGDPPPAYYRKPQGFSLTLQCDTAAEAERVFAALAEGGHVGQPLAPTFFAERFGALTDRFGIPWMVIAQPSPAPVQDHRLQ